MEFACLPGEREEKGGERRKGKRESGIESQRRKREGLVDIKCGEERAMIKETKEKNVKEERTGTGTGLLSLPLNSPHALLYRSPSPFTSLPLGSCLGGGYGYTHPYILMLASHNDREREAEATLH